MKSIQLDIEPKVLVWARKTIGYSPGEVARRLGVKEDVLGDWEEGIGRPTLAKARRLAEIYKRPFAAFLLDNPPQERNLPPDFRSLPTRLKAALLSQSRLAIRRARRIQELAEELGGQVNFTLLKKFSQYRIAQSPAKAAEFIREQSGISVERQFSWNDEREAFREWRAFVESLGVFVGQAVLPQEDKLRGFSISDQNPPVVVVNSKEHVHGRIFSLFHELAHILLKQGGMCDMHDPSGLKPSNSIEYICNQFSGAFLVPAASLVRNDLIQQHKGKGWDDEILRAIGTAYKVSKEVILRRLTSLELCAPDYYEKKRNQWQKEWGEREERKTGLERFARNVSRECVRDNGPQFVSLVFRAHQSGQISYGDVADYLGVRLRHLPSVEKLLREAQASEP